MSEQTPKYSMDADGQSWVYRRVGSRLERRPSYSRYFSAVTGEEFLKMTPVELRHVADVLSGASQ